MTGAAEHERLAALDAYDIIGADSGDRSVADLQSLCETAATVAGVPTAVVNLIDDRFQHQVAAFGVNPTPCRRDEAMCQTTLAGGRDIVVVDASADPRFASSPWVDGRLGAIRFYCSTILRTPQGHAIGTLCVFDESPREVGEQQLRAIRLLAGQAVDVLELRLATRRLAASNAELLRAQDRLASFAGQLSHDLKAPITAIVGFTELLGDIDAVTDDPSAGAYVERCSSASRRMLGMIDALLAFARVGGTLSPAPTELDTLVGEVVAELGPLSDGARITASGSAVVADPTQLRALLRNLIGNALVYRGEATPVIEVTSERVGDSMVLRVVDNGPGIPPERREEVLRPLVRLRKDLPGAGLGLAVCARIVAAHRGTLRLDGAPGGGTAAVVTLPA